MTPGQVHPTAVVEEGAEIHPSVTIGPYAVVGPRVRLGPGSTVGSHAVLLGETYLGAGNQVGPHVVLGAPPQLRDLLEDPGALHIGDGNVVREFVTVHAGRPGSTTRLGHRNLLMAYSHVAHDCQVGDGVEMANGVQLAGHVVVGDNATLGGLSAVHQFVRVGTHAFVGAGSMVSQDVLPYTLVVGDRARTFGLNSVGLRRNGFPDALRRDLGRAVRLLLGAPSLAEGLERARGEVHPSDAVLTLIAFVEQSRRGICRGAVVRAPVTGSEEA